MFVAPTPRLATLQGRNQWMPGLVEMLERVPVLRILAAADVAAGQAYAQLGPGRPEREALFTTVRAWSRRAKVAVMLTIFGHVRIAPYEAAKLGGNKIKLARLVPVARQL